MTEEKKTLADKIMDVMIPLSDKISSMKFLSAMTQASMSSMAVTLVGSIACLIANLDIPGTGIKAWIGQQVFMKQWLQMIQAMSITLVSFYNLLTLPYFYAEKLGYREKLMMIPLSVCAFLVLTPAELTSWGAISNIPTEWLQHKGLFSVWIVSWIVPTVCKWCSDHNLTIKMPAGVPRAIEQSFAVMIPGLIVIFPLGLIGRWLQTVESVGSFHNLIYTFIQLPFRKVGYNFWTVWLSQFVCTAAMFCGIHGSTVTTPFTLAGSGVTPEQLAIYNELSGKGLGWKEISSQLPHIMAGGWSNTVTIGGIGATLAMALMMLLWSKSARFKELNKVAFLPQMFNICEPYLFGIPIMLNPTLMIPYFGGVMLNHVISYFAVKLGIIAKFSGLTCTWTIPSPLKCFLTCVNPWQGLALCLFNLTIDCLIWTPFIKAADKQALAEEAEAAEAA